VRAIEEYDRLGLERSFSEHGFALPPQGEPADVHAIAAEYADWLGKSNVPKLFLKAEPGAILANDTLVNLVRRWPLLEVQGLPSLAIPPPGTIMWTCG
jgi:hypothetical protein